MSKKRTIDAFFGAPQAKKHRGSDVIDRLEIADSESHERNGAIAPNPSPQTSLSTHPTYPFPIPHLPAPIAAELPSLPSSIGKPHTSEPDLDLLYFNPYLPRSTAAQLFRFLRAELPFYRVEYDIKRFGTPTHIRTPRWTTVFGVDETARFVSSSPSATTSSPSSFSPPGNGAAKEVNVDEGNGIQALVSTASRTPINPRSVREYAARHPRPLPQCLDAMRRSAEAATGCRFNICLVNYYASGADSISFHSDDERFLGPDPAIASFSLGARRDFLMKHKPTTTPAPSKGSSAAAAAGAATTLRDKTDAAPAPEAKPLKFPLGSGDMILMRGPTQSHWLHSIPKRSGRNEKDGGRINITFRRAMVKGGTENYYNYNVGNGPAYKWDDASQEMRQWKPGPAS
ncbi:hypothetical protein F5Y15DRAFT_196123 [Xylariaceae sp. FL0016]|nr:hypothetical protein F5Y15DRAFT_196123 [Xylariaceae sp. FL0016]